MEEERKEKNQTEAAISLTRRVEQLFKFLERNEITNEVIAKAITNTLVDNKAELLKTLTLQELIQVYQKNQDLYVKTMDVTKRIMDVLPPDIPKIQRELLYITVGMSETNINSIIDYARAVKDELEI